MQLEYCSNLSVSLTYGCERAYSNCSTTYVAASESKSIVLGVNLVRLAQGDKFVAR